MVRPYYKRSRTFASNTAVIAKAAQVAARLARVSKSRSLNSAKAYKMTGGYQRQSGFYGRFQGKNAENKFFDTNLSFSFDTTGEVPATGQLTLIPQGVTESTRVGRKATIKSIHIRGLVNFVPGAAVATASDLLYLYLVLDKQCNGAAAAITDVLTSATMGIGMINMANSERFTVLKRITVQIASQAGATTAFANNSRIVDYYHKCNLPIEYSSTTGAITEIRSNNIFLLAAATLNDDISTMSGTCRLRFSDL